MKKLRTALLPLLFILCTSSLFAQKKDQKTIYKAKADLDYNLFKFRSAAEIYKHADTTNIEVIQKLALSYKAIKDYRQAEHWFDKQATFPDQPDQFCLDYAEILANNGNYRRSVDFYKKFLEKHPKDQRALNLSKTFDQLQNLRKDSANWTISFPSFNTPKDEFSPVYFNKGLIFTSNRDEKWGSKTMFGWNQTPFTDLYNLEDTASIRYLKPADYFNNQELFKLSRAREQELPKTINDNKVLGDVTYPITLAFLELRNDSTPVKILDKSINTRLHDGPMSFTADQSLFFYNRNHIKMSSEGDSKIGIYKLNMWSGNYVGGSWINIKPFPYNSIEYSTAHPALTPDGSILYFVSDMPGGYGGKDIYYCLKTGDSWSKPVNIGPEINTEGDETFPYIAPNGDMYFSSNGHTGLGGLDIFRVKLKNNQPASAIVNLGYPVNSPKDDFSLIIDQQNISGFFSSNRYGSDDIFRFSYDPLNIMLKGKVIQLVSGNRTAIPNALVALTYNDRTDSVYADNIGDYAFNLSINEDYNVSASKPGFTSSLTSQATTKGIKKSTTLIRDLELTVNQPVVAEVPVKTAPPVMTCEEITRVFKVDNIYYDLDKYNIRPDAIANVNKVIALMKQYPELRIVVASHTDSRASNTYNEKLSINRSNSVIHYLVSHGIDASRLSSQYFGELRPVNGCTDGVNCDEINQQLNRRTEFYMFLNGRNITIECGL